MVDINTFFIEVYKNFNERRIDLVISKMTDHVKWANGMEGGYVFGKNGVEEYWLRQFTQVSSKVTPLTINKEDEVIKINVHQVVHDLNGKLLADELVDHYFRLENEKIASFEIGEKVKTES